MSDTEEPQEGDSEAESVVYAIAPKLSQEQGQVDVSSSPAFQCLDDVSVHYNYLKSVLKQNMTFDTYM